MGTGYASVVGAPPVCTRLDFKRWEDSLVRYRIAECPSARATTYFFAMTGGNNTNDGRDNVGFNLSAASWNPDTKTLTKTGAFTSYTWNAWDQIYISGGTGVATGLYAIASRTDNDNIVLATSISAGSPSDVTSSTGPKQTIASAQALLNAGASNIRIRLKRGNTWQETNSFNFTGNNITIDDWGDPSLPKPYLKKFTTYAAGSWANTSGAVYEQPESNTVAWVREKDDVRPGSAYIRGTSITDVQANPGSWWWDTVAQKIYIQTRLGQVPTSTAITYDVVYTNTVAGIKCSGDNIRIENIRCDGWSAVYSATAGSSDNTSNYNFRFEGSGTNVCLMIGCEGYYSTFHNFGLNCSTTGGILTLVNCRAGRLVSVTGTNFVGYAASGNQEYIVHNYETIGGCLKQIGQNYSNAQDGGVGQPCYAHTDAAGGHLVGLGIVWGGRNTRDQYQEGNASIIANAPTFADLKDCRAFVVEEEFLCRDITTLDAANEGVATRYIGNDPGDWNGVYINCVRESRYYSSNNEASHYDFGNWHGIAINCRFLFDFVGNKSVNAVGGVAVMYNLANNAANWTATLYNCSLEIRGNGNAGVATLYLCANTNTSPNAATAGGYFNCLLVARGLSSGASAYVALKNDALFLNHNAYSGFNFNAGAAKTDTFRGYSSDPNLVDATGVIPAVRPGPTSPLITTTGNRLVAPGNYTLEYDASWAPRSNTPAIGPYEPSGAIYTTPRIIGG